MFVTNYLKVKIKKSPKWKVFIHGMMFHNARPRLWIKLLVNPFCFRHGKGCCIRRQCVLNVSPVNDFKVGDYSTIEEYSLVDNGVGSVLIGSHTRIGLRSTLIGPVEIGDNVILAQNIVLSGLNHRYEDPDRPIHRQGVTTAAIHIGNDSWIGANAVVTAGVTIGKHVIVGAGSIVTKDIPDYCIAVGNPARIVKKWDSETKDWIKTL